MPVLFGMSRGRQVLAFIVTAAFGAAVGFGAAAAGIDAQPGYDLSRGEALGVIAALPLVYMLVIAVHEGGHVAGGLIARFRPLLCVVGPLRIERTGGGSLRVGINRSLALGGGLTVSAPVGLHDLRRRAILMVAGGPVVSLMFAVQCLAFHVALSPLLLGSTTAAARLTMALLLLVGAGSLLVGAVTLLPMRTGGFYSDGARLLRLMRTTADAEREVALLALAGLTLDGTRPRDWDPRLVQSGAAIRDDGPFEVSGRQFAYAHALDRGDIDGAREHVEAALAGIRRLPAGSRPALLLSAATFFALYDGDADRARDLLRAAGGEQLISSPHQRLLAEAAVSFAEGDTAAAERTAREAQRLAALALDRGGAALDQSLAGRIIMSA
jgi:hypothetical protein